MNAAYSSLVILGKLQIGDRALHSEISKMAYSSNQVVEITGMSISTLIIMYAFYTALKSYWRANPESHSVLYKTLLLTGCTIQLLVITGHTISSSVVPLIDENTNSGTLYILHLITHTLCYRSQLHFILFALFSWAVFLRFKVKTV